MICISLLHLHLAEIFEMPAAVIQSDEAQAAPCCDESKDSKARSSEFLMRDF